MPTRSYRISGKVQGVGYRAFVVSLARELGVDGEVWNGHDGTVQAYAAHAEDSVLDEFGSKLHDGPGRVGVVIATETDLPVEPGFFISSTR